MGQRGGRAPVAVRTGAAAGRALVGALGLAGVLGLAGALELAASAPAGAASVGGAGQEVVGGAGQVVAGDAGRAVVGGAGQASVPSDAVLNILLLLFISLVFFFLNLYLAAAVLLGWDAWRNPALLTGRAQQSQQNNQH